MHGQAAAVNLMAAVAAVDEIRRRLEAPRGHDFRGRQAAMLPSGRKRVRAPLIRPKKGVDGPTCLRSVVDYCIPSGCVGATPGCEMLSDDGQLFNARR